jgi:subtilisin family serine protease
MTIVTRRMLAAAAVAAFVSAVAAPSAWAVPGERGQVRQAGHGAGTEPRPRAGEWWLTTWKMVPVVWPLTEGAGVTVAVVDTGVQASVPDLRGAVLPGGDVTGHHADGQTDFNTDGDGHGTMMSVLIAGRGYGTGMIGMAPEAKILPVVVHATAADRTADPAMVAAGIVYAANHGARVIDVSQEHPAASASGCDAAEQAAVAYALARDIVVIAAAGDTGLTGTGPDEPASCAGVVAVGAVGPNRALWPGNTSQPYITVVNPGAGLITSGRDGRLVSGVSGTRAASALAAGAVAVIRSRYPAMPWYQVIQRLTGTALPEGGHVPNDSFGYGILRLSHAVNAAAYPVPASAPNPVYARYRAWLATPQGRAVSRRLSRPASRPAAAAPAAGGGGSAAPVLMAVLVPLAAAGAVALALALRMRGRPVSRKPRHGRPLKRPAGTASGAPADEVPADEAEEYFPDPDLRYDDSQGQYLLLGERTAYRIPPYSPAPEPRSSSARTDLLGP